MSANFSADRQFQRLGRGARDVDLPELMLEFARDRYPHLDFAPCRAELARLSRASKKYVRLLGPEAPRFEQLQSISRLLYVEEGFHGNREQYHDPLNSYLNEVLVRRCGLPITLGVIYLHVARQAGLPVFGVGAPGHFVLGCAKDGGQPQPNDAYDAASRPTWYIDPFTAGDVLSAEQCLERIAAMTDLPGPLSESLLRPASCRAIAVRVLRNLKSSYALLDDWPHVLPVQQRLCLLELDAVDEVRDLGLVFLRMGQAGRALPLLERYLKNCPASQIEAVEPYRRAARRMLAEMN